MTAEMQQLANDPNFVVEFAVGAPIPDLIPQSKDSGIKINGVYFDKTKRYGKNNIITSFLFGIHTIYFIMMCVCLTYCPDLIPSSFSILFYISLRYIMKSCHLSKDDVRILDMDTGRVVLVSHHPGKNPYETLDPLGLGNTGNQHAVQGGEWESSCDVTSRHHSMPSFKIRPKSLSRHGRQYIKKMHGKKSRG